MPVLPELRKRRTKNLLHKQPTVPIWFPRRAFTAGTTTSFERFTSLKDITDRREAERRYRRERDFNRNILNNTQSMILVLDTAGLSATRTAAALKQAIARTICSGIRSSDMVPPARQAGAEGGARTHTGRELRWITWRCRLFAATERPASSRSA